MGIAHQPLLVSENYSDCRFVWYQNIRSPSFSSVTIHASDGRTDRQTDGRTELRQQYRALHYMQSHGKNDEREKFEKLRQSVKAIDFLWMKAVCMIDSVVRIQDCMCERERPSRHGHCISL